MPTEATVERVRSAPTTLAGFSAAGWDYWDTFRVAVERDDIPPAEWAWLALRGVERAGGAFGTLVWGGVLGFDLAAAREDGTLVGWQIAHDSERLFVLEADGSLMAGRMAFELTGDGLEWTTMLRYHHRLARPVWTAVGPAHRAIVPVCLRTALRAAERRPARAPAATAG